MLPWIIGVVVLAVVVWAFWPRRKGIADGTLRRSVRNTQDHASREDRTIGGTGAGGF
jgi:hypothetical protein